MGKSIIASYKSAIVLLLIYALGLAIATFVEKYFGTQAAKLLIYYSPLFFLLQLLLVANFVLTSVRHQLFKKGKWGFILVHSALIVILAGAFITHVFSKEGVVHLRENESSDQMLVQTNRGESYHPLPFRLELKQFTMTRYPGSSSPSSFESNLIIHRNNQSFERKVSMNNVLDLDGYRFFQASYDKDEKGTILSVNQDVAGRNVTYTGYSLLIIGFILCFIGKNSRFRQLARQLRLLRRSAPRNDAQRRRREIMHNRMQAQRSFRKADTYTTKPRRGDIIKTLIISPLRGLVAGAFPIRRFRSATPTVMHNLTPAALSVNVTLVMLFCSSFFFSLNAQTTDIDPVHAARFGTLPIQSIDGRLKPTNTFSSEVLRKLHHSDKIGSLNSDQFLISLLAQPEKWMHIPFITYSNKDIAFNYDLPAKQCAYVDLFDTNGNYKLQETLNEVFHKSPSERSRLDKDLIKLDEQINIFHQLINNGMFAVLPVKGDSNHKWNTSGALTKQYLEAVSNALQTGNWQLADNALELIRTYQKENSGLDIIPERINAELLYNQLNVFRLCKKCYLIVGGLLLILSFLSLFRKQKWLKWSIRFLTVVVIANLLYHLFGTGLRWYIAGHAPWSNAYETMVYVSFVTVLAGLLFVRQSSITFALATLFGGIILFVSGLNWMDPQISPLVPVLKSPWLMFHVAVIVAAYGFFGISFLLGSTNLCLLSVGKKQNTELTLRELSIINEMSLWAGLALMTIGTFLGAIWANESWGRYWGWDPKETWALITIVVYAMVTHLHLIKKWNNPRLFNLLSILAFACVLMTYFGVNYFLSGMHSYGRS